MNKKRLNLGKLDERPEYKAPLQTVSKGVVKSETERSSFEANEEKYKEFKIYALRNSISIKDLLTIQIKHRIYDKGKINKDDYVFNEDKKNLKTFTLRLPSDLFIDLKVWLEKNNLFMRELINKIINDILESEKK